VADAPPRQVVLIVEDEALVRMTAVVMIEEAGFEVLEAATADEAIVLLEARRDITVVFTDIEMPGSMDGLRLAQAVRADGRPSKSSRHRAVTSCVKAICRPAGFSCENHTALPRFPARYGISRPGPEHGPPGHRKKIRKPLETGSAFSSFWHAAIRGPGALRGPGGDGRRRCPTPARTHLAQRRIWL
jgi:CheY-like chemotaxis protein